MWEGAPPARPMGNFLSKAHILIADPNALVCEALRRLVELEVEVLGIVCDDSSLFRTVQALKPEGVLLSIYAPFSSRPDNWVKIEIGLPRFENHRSYSKR